MGHGIITSTPPPHRSEPSRIHHHHTQNRTNAANTMMPAWAKPAITRPLHILYFLVILIALLALPFIAFILSIQSYLIRTTTPTLPESRSTSCVGDHTSCAQTMFGKNLWGFPNFWVGKKIKQRIKVFGVAGIAYQFDGSD